MSTRNFVPRSGSEGQLGTQAKPWGVVVADIGHFATLSGSISGSQYSTGSFGRLHVAGDSNINGDVTIGGNISIGDSDTDSLTIAADLTSNLVPNADSTFDIGSSAKNWKIGHIEQVSSTNITASSDISSSGDIFGTNLLADSASFSTRVTDLKSDSGSFSTRVTDLKSDSGSFSSRITIAENELEETLVSASAQLADQISGSFTAPSASLSTRVTDLKTDSGSFSDRVTLSEVSSSAILEGDFVFTNITASGNISASGDIRSDGRIFEKNTSVIDHATAMAIVFGG